MYEAVSPNRYIVNNLVIGLIAAGTTVEVPVALNGIQPGDVGIAIPRGAIFTAGIAINPVRCTTAGTALIPFVNGSAGGITPVATFDFDVFLFRAAGALSGTV